MSVFWSFTFEYGLVVILDYASAGNVMLFVAEHTGTMEKFIQPLLQVNALSLIQCSLSFCYGSKQTCYSGLQFTVASYGSNARLLLTWSPGEGFFPFSL